MDKVAGLATRRRGQLGLHRAYTCTVAGARGTAAQGLWQRSARRYASPPVAVRGTGRGRMSIQGRGRRSNGARMGEEIFRRPRLHVCRRASMVTHRVPEHPCKDAVFVDGAVLDTALPLPDDLLLLLEPLVQQVDLHGKAVLLDVAVKVGEVLVVLDRLIVHGEVQLVGQRLGLLAGRGACAVGRARVGVGIGREQRFAPRGRVGNTKMWLCMGASSTMVCAVPAVPRRVCAASALLRQRRTVCAHLITARVRVRSLQCVCMLGVRCRVFPRTSVLLPAPIRPLIPMKTDRMDDACSAAQANPRGARQGWLALARLANSSVAAQRSLATKARAAAKACAAKMEACCGTGNVLLRASVCACLRLPAPGCACELTLAVKSWVSARRLDIEGVDGASTCCTPSCAAFAVLSIFGLCCVRTEACVVGCVGRLLKAGAWGAAARRAGGRGDRAEMRIR